MAEGACLILVVGQARIRLIRRYYRIVFLRLSEVIESLRLVVLCDTLMLCRCFCGGDQGVELLLVEMFRLGLRCGCYLCESGNGEDEYERENSDCALYGSLLVDFLGLRQCKPEGQFRPMAVSFAQ